MIQDHYEYYNLVISHDLFSTSKHSKDIYSSQMDVKKLKIQILCPKFSSFWERLKPWLLIKPDDFAIVVPFDWWKHENSFYFIIENWKTGSGF